MHAVLFAFLSSWPHSSINDEITLIKSLLAYGLIAVMVLYPLIRGVMAYRDSGSLVSFIPLASILVVIGGVWAWFRHFVEHGGFFLWPLLVVGVLILLQIIRAVHEQRVAEQNAADAKTFPEPPNTGGPASKSDFKRWVRKNK